MPMVFRKGQTVFMPRERALYVAEDGAEGIPCKINKLLSSEGVFSGYAIEIEDKPIIFAAIEQIHPLL
jgi:hypothetical protein